MSFKKLRLLSYVPGNTFSEKAQEVCQYTMVNDLFCHNVAENQVYGELWVTGRAVGPVGCGAGLGTASGSLPGGSGSYGGLLVGALLGELWC